MIEQYLVKLETVSLLVIITVLALCCSNNLLRCRLNFWIFPKFVLTLLEPKAMRVLSRKLS